MGIFLYSIFPFLRLERQKMKLDRQIAKQILTYGDERNLIELYVDLILDNNIKKL